MPPPPLHRDPDRRLRRGVVAPCNESSPAANARRSRSPVVSDAVHSPPDPTSIVSAPTSRCPSATEALPLERLDDAAPRSLVCHPAIVSGCADASASCAIPGRENSTPSVAHVLPYGSMCERGAARATPGQQPARSRGREREGAVWLRGTVAASTEPMASQFAGLRKPRNAVGVVLARADPRRARCATS
jgi:hypothetical protein